MPCVSKPSCTHGIIISLWLIFYIQCGLSISSLSIPWIVAHNRCNISHIFAFSFQFECPISCCVFHLYKCFSGGFKMGQRGSKFGGKRCGVIIICFKIFVLFNFSQCLWTSFLLFLNEIYYDYNQYLFYHYYHYYCFGYYFFIYTMNIIIQIIVK